MSEISIRSIEDYYQSKNPFQGNPEINRKPVDLKIQDLVFSHISRYSPSTLLATAVSPHVVIDLIPGVAMSNDAGENSYNSVKNEKKGRRVLERTWPNKYIPLGLSPCGVFPPITAILQFILFLPSFRDLFSFAPRSFTPLIDFLDQYAIDQEKNISVSSADPSQLFRVLFQKMPSHFFHLDSGKIEMREFLFALVKTVFGRVPPISNSLAFHPEWHAVWDISLPFSCSIDLPARPPELFLTFKNRLDFLEAPSEPAICRLVQRQFFTKPDSYCYDLDAFIEYRPDGKDRRGAYIAYLKNEGTWYQCDDERITALRSNHLNMPLYRSVLLHYKRIWPN